MLSRYPFGYPDDLLLHFSAQIGCCLEALFPFISFSHCCDDLGSYMCFVVFARGHFVYFVIVVPRVLDSRGVRLKSRVLGTKLGACSRMGISLSRETI